MIEEFCLDYKMQYAWSVEKHIRFLYALFLVRTDGNEILGRYDQDWYAY